MHVYVPFEDKPPASFEGKLEPAVVCADQRSQTAAESVLRRHGFTWHRGRWKAPKRPGKDPSPAKVRP